MDQSWSNEHGTSKGHNFQTISPNEMALFATFLFQLLVSKIGITWHAFHSYKYLHFQLTFGGKIKI
jgi:hypothetical protein